MPSIIGAVLVILAGGATLAAVSKAGVSIWQNISDYIRGIYDRTSARKNTPER